MRNPIHMILERMTLWISVKWLAIQVCHFIRHPSVQNRKILFFYCVFTQFSHVNLKLLQQTVKMTSVNNGPSLALSPGEGCCRLGGVKVYWWLGREGRPHAVTFITLNFLYPRQDAKDSNYNNTGNKNNRILHIHLQWELPDSHCQEQMLTYVGKVTTC